jgi:hypothetical protein
MFIVSHANAKYYRAHTLHIELLSRKKLDQKGPPFKNCDIYKGVFIAFFLSFFLRVPPVLMNEERRPEESD